MNPWKRKEVIGNATLYLGLSKHQRYRLRKKGVEVPFAPRPKGYKQSQDHIEKRKRPGSLSHHWLGDAVSVKGGRTRALRAYKNIGPCVRCGSGKSERHHKDGNTANNASSNIEALCRRCHMEADGRMEKALRWRKP